MAVRLMRCTSRCADWFGSKNEFLWTAQLPVPFSKQSKFRHEAHCLSWTTLDQLEHAIHADVQRNSLVFYLHGFRWTTHYFCSAKFSSRKGPEDLSHDLMKQLDAENLSKHGKNLSPSDAMVNVGKMVPHKVLDLVDDNGGTYDSIPSSRAVALAQQRDLKLVLVNQHAKPRPLYKLMTGAELHMEQVKLDEKKKSRVHPTTMKEVKLTAGIGLHDLNVKRKHIADWLKKDSHIQIRVSVLQKGRQAATKEEMEEVIHRLIDDMDVPLVYNNEPKLTGKHQQNMSVVVRPMSTKERAKLNKEKNLLEKMKSVSPSEDS